MFLKRTAVVLGCLAAFGLAGCATVGPSSVKLSAETSARSAELAKLHQDLVRAYFAGERHRVETFLRETWEPQFLRNLLGMSGIMDDLKASIAFDASKRKELSLAMKMYLTDPSESDKLAAEITSTLTKTRATEPDAVRTVIQKYVPNAKVESATTHAAALLGTAEPALLILEFAEDAHAEMEKQRQAMIGPIDAAEKQVLAELGDAYTTLARAQGTITARLEAASRAAQQQDQLLQAVGVTDPAAIRMRLAGFSDTVSSALDAAGVKKDPNEILTTLRNALARLPGANPQPPPTPPPAPTPANPQ
jgi:hypothetical protein